MKTLELVFYIPIFVIGTVCNGWALFVFCHILPRWRESTIYMTNLVFMDLILLFPLPFKMHATNHMWAAQSRGLCSFLESLYFIGMYGSIYTIACIAVDRWLGICHPLNAMKLRSPMAACLTCAGVWVAVLAALSPVYGFHEDGHRQFHCFHGFSPKVWRTEVIVCVEVFGYVLPALVIVCCSVQTVWTLNKSGQRSAQSRACVKVIYSSMAAFLAPFTPSHLAILLQFLVRLASPVSYHSHLSERLPHSYHSHLSERSHHSQCKHHSRHPHHAHRSDHFHNSHHISQCGLDIKHPKIQLSISENNHVKWIEYNHSFGRNIGHLVGVR